MCVCYVLNSAVDVWFNVCVVDYMSMPVLYCTTNCLSGTFKFSKSKSKSMFERPSWSPHVFGMCEEKRGNSDWPKIMK